MHEWVTSGLAYPAAMGWKDVPASRTYPREFRADVVRVARDRRDGVTIEWIATQLGVHPMTLAKWMRQADIDEGTKPGKAPVTQRSCRTCVAENRLLEREN